MSSELCQNRRQIINVSATYQKRMRFNSSIFKTACFITQYQIANSLSFASQKNFPLGK